MGGTGLRGEDVEVLENEGVRYEILIRSSTNINWALVNCLSCGDSTRLPDYLDGTNLVAHYNCPGVGFVVTPADEPELLIGNTTITLEPNIKRSGRCYYCNEPFPKEIYTMRELLVYRRDNATV